MLHKIQLVFQFLDHLESVSYVAVYKLQFFHTQYAVYSLFLGTHEVQDLVVTVNAQQVCIACVLADWANKNSCQVTIYSEMTQIFKTITIMSSSTTTLMNCTENIPPGYYHIIAYDTDNVSNPAVKMYRYLNTTLPQGRVILCMLLFLTL